MNYQCPQTIKIEEDLYEFRQCLFVKILVVYQQLQPFRLFEIEEEYPGLGKEGTVHYIYHLKMVA